MKTLIDTPNGKPRFAVDANYRPTGSPIKCAPLVVAASCARTAASAAPDGGRAPAPLPLDNNEKIDRSIAYMAQHLDQPLNVAKLAALASISSSHFFALFKRRTGSPPMDYFIRLRMLQARRLLDDTTLRIKDIAARLGYDDAFYFSRLFKSVNNLSPTDYRTKERRPVPAAQENGQRIVHANHSFLHSSHGSFPLQKIQDPCELRQVSQSPTSARPVCCELNVRTTTPLPL